MTLANWSRITHSTPVPRLSRPIFWLNGWLKMMCSTQFGTIRKPICKLCREPTKFSNFWWKMIKWTSHCSDFFGPSVKQMSQTRPKFLRLSLRPITTWNSHTSNSFSMSWRLSRLTNSLKANLIVCATWVRLVRTLSSRARSVISFGVSLFKQIITRKTLLRTVFKSMQR